ncbi:hypothetical protein HanXRQr2_Chr02g0065271 [Helianthus annuus]|uniref:Uncharacterized protein n=1 Tax=Helianthus annuus TaxID=4232 RepID=A0A251VDQ9_HELAN|nr:hypothetical protein HanXRQr2_Chr02g0065271 [Helianthus annuus]
MPFTQKKKHTRGTQLGFLILIPFYPPPSSCFISRRFKRRSRVSLGDANARSGFLNDTRSANLSLYDTQSTEFEGG